MTSICDMSNSKGNPKKVRNGRFQPIGVAMQKPSRSIGGKRGFRDQTLLNHWDEFAGSELSAICKPREIKARRSGGSILTVECLSARASELAMRAEELRARLNMKLGYEAIGKIMIHHQHIGFDLESRPVLNQNTTKACTRRPLPAELSQDLASTSNSDLREALQRFSDSFYNKGAANAPD